MVLHEVLLHLRCLLFPSEAHFNPVLGFWLAFIMRIFSVANETPAPLVDWLTDSDYSSFQWMFIGSISSY